jgi:hypothetical protein
MGNQGQGIANTGALSAAGLSPAAYNAAQTLYALTSQGMSPEEALRAFSENVANNVVTISPDEREKVVNLFVGDVKASRESSAGTPALDVLKDLNAEDLAPLIPALQQDLATQTPKFNAGYSEANDLLKAAQDYQQNMALRKQGSAERRAAEKKAASEPSWKAVLRKLVGAVPVVQGINQLKMTSPSNKIDWGGEEGQKIVEKNMKNVDLLKELVKMREQQNTDRQALIDSAVSYSLKQAGITQPAPSNFDMQKLILMRGLRG